ncbi:peptidoglycan-binding domain-containing protein [Streptomyces sp. NBC_01443]|uniref:peptidoglycan-binding domain-containing protein n=1 Tax=Streptomyces sp. NBC_01443 TaxID=2903868 RepID=UPI002251B481|nr:peptidoglycan-binding domain-containing protein [Streptomyces sp. NBC_01443]MCX4631574.1 peptidoglycan-binding protein [Streptomyces sp. NBC_01443]
MSHHPDESASVPDDRRLVGPYVASSQRPYRATTPAWPHTGPVPVSFRAPDGRLEDDPQRPAGATGAADARAGRRDRGGPLLPAVLALLALGAAGGLVFLLSGPDPRPERAVAPPELSVPMLPARSSGAGDEPSPEGSVRASASSAAASASAGPSASRTPKSTPPPSASAGQQPTGASGTLRMGDRGPEVSALQERLRGQGFTYVDVTGVYDSQTKRGVAQLQRDRDIKGDQPGVYGPATRAAFGG